MPERVKNEISQTEQLLQTLRCEVDKLKVGGATEVDPAVASAAALLTLDPLSVTPALVSWAATLELRQLSRGLLRSQADRDTGSADQPSLFPLQAWYPATRYGREVYVKRMHMSIAERRRMANRLRSEAAEKHQHADALDAETDELVRRGVLTDDERAAALEEV